MSWLVTRHRDLLLFAILLSQGCLSSNVYQTAQVKPQGEWELGAAVGGSYVADACFAEECAGYSTPNGLEPLPNTGTGGVEVLLRVGMGHRLDFGARIGTVGARVDFKLQLLDTRYFDLAIDLGVSADVREVRLSLPVILSSRMHRWFAVFGSAQALLSRWRFNSDGQDVLLGPGVAASFGVSIGPAELVTVRPEFTYNHMLTDFRSPDGLSEPSFRYWSFGIAVVFAAI